MSIGTFYGIGVGPGDPELITVKGARLIAACGCVVVPKSRMKKESIALKIAKQYISPGAEIVEQVYPMTSDKALLQEKWSQAAGEVLNRLRKPQDVCFLTLGDPLFYSTHIYLLRCLKELDPELKTVTIPGIMAMGAASAITDFPLGEAKKPVTVVPTSDDLVATRQAIKSGGNVVLMKVGERLQPILDLLQELGVIDRAVFVAKAGQDAEVVVTDLMDLKESDPKTGYLSIILIDADKEECQ
ncbi:MAG: precorrin-2 C(20)-methyltransferase [Kiritimatiellia bacterium]|jgi:precorrin-2/cobalt-factor-2 C20-methyltransferase|nr:precorrin-2 C(20)-methyltransferase [Kiritimatiellia bacterium]